MEQLRRVPQVQALLETGEGRSLIARYSRAEVVEAIRGALDAVRSAVRQDAGRPMPDFFAPPFFERLEERIALDRRARLRRVINATGVIIHTNLGRAPLAPEALHAIQETAGAYANVELDLESGKRGSRHALVEDLICTLTGAEAALAVNNCAAAVLVCLSGLAAGGEVVASRGELIEIGGSFRMPDVIAQSGARLREVGATNKTTLTDYERGIGPDTRVLLKSHTSNYRIVGFTAAPERKALAALAHRHDLLLVEDLGSGVLVDLAPFGLGDEPVVRDILATGVDIVTFSADKLLGGPQAGIIAGRRDVIQRLKRHPLVRAMRVDKLSLAALEATLRLYRPPHDPFKMVPVLRMLAEDVAAVDRRAHILARAIRECTRCSARVEPSIARAGGGALPQQDLPSLAVAVAAPDRAPEDLARDLRRADPPVIGRLTDGKLLLDARTVDDGELPLIVAGLARAPA